MIRKIPVLFVDESNVCDEITAHFADSCFEIHCYTDVNTAQKELNSSRFEIAVVDLRATLADGGSFIEHLVDAIPKIRCIAMVEKPDVASVQTAMKLGCKSYLAKPVSADAALKAIQDVAQTCGLFKLSDRELQLRLSRLLRAQRLRQEVTLTEMANRVGLSKAQLSQIELGKSWPSFPTLKRISDELDQPFSTLFRAVEEESALTSGA